MNTITKTGLILQIPNLIAIIFLAFAFGITTFEALVINIQTMAWVIVGSVYGILNITSIVLIIAGLTTPKKYDRLEY